MSDSNMIEMVDLSEKVHEELEENLQEVEEASTYDYEYEQTMARELYDRDDVKQAGQVALSKVSNLLVRYNRLKDAQKKKKADTELRIKIAENRRDRKLEELQNEKVKVATLTDDNQKKKALELIAQREKMAIDTYNEDLREIDEKAESTYLMGLSENIESDRSGGILSSLLLGGNAQGSTGYTLTNGDAADLMKGSEYIQDVAGKEGTFLSQMALLDNAINTNGMDLRRKDDEDRSWGIESGPDEDDFVGSSARGAKYSLGDLLRNVTEEDITEINRFSGEKMTVDLETIQSEREYGGLDAQIGVQGEKKTILQVAKERGVIKEDTRTGLFSKEVKIVATTNFSDELQARKSGKYGGLNNLSEEEKQEIIQGGKSLIPVPGFFGRNREKPDYRMAKRGVARRQALREERIAWQNRMSLIASGKNRPVLTFEKNENDTAKKVLPLRQPEAQALEAAFGDQDKSARNMIAAYRLLGASPKELYMFRLALMAYMIPTGKKTLAQILKESEEAGYKGNEDLSTPKTMYATFKNEPVVDGLFVNNFKKQKQEKKNEKERLKNMNQANRKNMMEALANQQKKEKTQEEVSKNKVGAVNGIGGLSVFLQKKNAEEKRMSKWTNTVQNSITEMEESEEENEFFIEPSEFLLEENRLQKEQENRNAKWTQRVEENFSEDEEIKELEEEAKGKDAILDKAMLQHFEIVGKNLPEDELLRTFKAIFEEDQEQEQFGNVLLPQELTVLRDNIENTPYFDLQIRACIKKLTK